MLDRQTQSCACSANSEYIGGARVSRAELLQTQTMFAQGVVRGQTRPIDGRIVTQVDVDGTLLDVEARTAWRSGIRSTSRLLPTPATGTPSHMYMFQNRAQMLASYCSGHQRKKEKNKIIESLAVFGSHHIKIEIEPL